MVRALPARVLIAGGGYLGLYAALRLEKRLKPGEAQITLVNPDNFMLYQPLLPEMASGMLEPRHVVVPLRQALRRTHVITGNLTGLDPRGRTATVQPLEGPEGHLRYDHAVLGIGAVSKVLPVPGVAEHAVGFKGIEEALYLRNHVLSRLDAAASTSDEATRRAALTFVFVGGGYTGVEAMAELEDLARDACQLLPSIRPRDLRFILVEVTDRILPTVQSELADYATGLLRQRGIEVRLETSVEEAKEGMVRLSTGEEIATDTLVWVTGVEPHPLLRELDLPVDDQGRLKADACLRVEGVEGLWTGGDCAAVPDPDGGTYPATAQHAEREGRHLGDNIVAALRGGQPAPFRFRSLGEMITLGRYQGAAEILGRRIRGFPAWFLRRGYYASSIPTVHRKLRILGEWTIGLPFGRDVVHFGRVQHPGQSLTGAAPGAKAS